MITLTDPALGTLELRSDPFIVVGFDISSPATRAVARNRALADGTFDDTRYTGARAVTVTVRLNEKLCGGTQADATMQALFDRLLPFMHPKRRLTLAWSLPGSGDQRQMTVRGDSAPVSIQQAKHPVVVLQFVAPDAEITSAGDPICTSIVPAVDTELGRAYDLAFDRSYPASSAIGDRTVTVAGNAPAHWDLTIFGELTNPSFKVNGTTIFMSSGDGVDIVEGENLTISTRERTVLLNDNPADPRYDRTNFTAWTWGDLLLQPGPNQIRFGAEVLGPGASALLCYRPTWAG